MRREGGGEGRKEKRNKRMKEKYGRSESKAKGKTCIMHHHAMSGEGEGWCIYSIGFRWKQIELTSPEIYHIDYRLHGESRPRVRSIMASAFMGHHQGSWCTETGGTGTKTNFISHLINLQRNRRNHCVRVFGGALMAFYLFHYLFLFACLGYHGTWSFNNLKDLTWGYRRHVARMSLYK